MPRNRHKSRQGKLYYMHSKLTLDVPDKAKTRPSIAEVYNRLSEDEAKAQALAQHERELYAKRWANGQQILFEFKTRNLRDRNTQRGDKVAPPDDSLHESDMDNDPVFQKESSVSISTSPPYSPPKSIQRSNTYPMESSIYPNFSPARPQIQREVNISDWEQLVVEPETQSLAQDGLTIDWKNDDTMATEQRATQEPQSGRDYAIQEGELWKMVRLLKEVLKEPPAKTQAGKASWHQMVSSMKSDGLDMDALIETTSADSLAMDLRLEKISLDDAEYAQRLDHIRNRLGSLVTTLHSSYKEKQNDTREFKKVVNTYSWFRLSKESAKRVFYTIFILLACSFMMLRWLMFQAEYLFEYSYHDLIYDDIFPVPLLVQRFLSPTIAYNTPFSL